MKSRIGNIKSWLKKDWDEIMLLIFVGLPTGIFCILLSRYIDILFVY
jgi:hypothetical protein